MHKAKRRSGTTGRLPKLNSATTLRAVLAPPGQYGHCTEPRDTLMQENSYGISGISAYVPPYRVNLESWCGWTGNNWDKTRTVIGRSFRMRGPEHSVYTMAANAVLRLIDSYAIDPRNIGYLALGTESSIDNAAGAVIVRGLVDRALQAEGHQRLARDCEVPELKHACLGGIYAIKGALRYLAFDGHGRQAIVVSADIAEYARGSSGEPTQGAGAIAMLLEQSPTLLTLDLHGAGSASDYRGLDFRKPFLRFSGQSPGHNGRLKDLPIFNGKYSTTCYVDESLHALDAMFAKRQGSRSAYFRDLACVFMHRPYHRMPHSALALGYLFALGQDGGDAHRELEAYCAAANIALNDLLSEMNSHPDVARLEGGDLSFEAYPLSMLALKAFRETETHRQVVEAKMQLGSDAMMDLGNLYTAAMPAWLAAGLDQAAKQNAELDGREMLLMGYGSGDAAEAIPARIVSGWKRHAVKIKFNAALDHPVDLELTQYQALHDGRIAGNLQPAPPQGFIVDRIGTRDERQFQDYGIEYYRYVGMP